MAWTRARDRLAVIDAFPFPSSVRQRFTHVHGDLTIEDFRTAEAATRQWFRLAARHPRAKLTMPSSVVANLWHDLTQHTREYAEFCDAAFGRFLHETPEPVGADRYGGLPATLRLAQQDEGCAPDRLPLLFRVDQALGVAGAQRYLADCGGRGQCFELKGTLCLQHVTGPGKTLRRGYDLRRPPGAGPTGTTGMEYGGCGA